MWSEKRYSMKNTRILISCYWILAAVTTTFMLKMSETINLKIDKIFQKTFSWLRLPPPPRNVDLYLQGHPYVQFSAVVSCQLRKRTEVKPSIRIPRNNFTCSRIMNFARGTWSLITWSWIGCEGEIRGPTYWRIVHPDHANLDLIRYGDFIKYVAYVAIVATLDCLSILRLHYVNVRHVSSLMITEEPDVTETYVM